MIRRTAIVPAALALALLLGGCDGEAAAPGTVVYAFGIPVEG